MRTVRLLNAVVAGLIVPGCSSSSDEANQDPSSPVAEQAEAVNSESAKMAASKAASFVSRKTAVDSAHSNLGDDESEHLLDSVTDGRADETTGKKRGAGRGCPLSCLGLFFTCPLASGHQP